MPSVRNTITNAPKCQAGRSEPNRDQCYRIAFLPEVFKKTRKEPRGKRGLKGKVSTSFGKFVNTLQLRSPGLIRDGSRVETRKPTGNMIRIYEINDPEKLLPCQGRDESVKWQDTKGLCGRRRSPADVGPDEEWETKEGFETSDSTGDSTNK